MERRSDKFNNVVKGSVPVSRRVVSQSQLPKVTQRVPILRDTPQNTSHVSVPVNKASKCGCSRKKPS